MDVFRGRFQETLSSLPVEVKQRVSRSADDWVAHLLY